MKRDKLTPGIILVFIGLVILLSNLGYLHFHWINIIHLWPVFLIVGGINLLFASNHSPWARVLKIVVLVGAFSLILFGDFGNRFSFIPGIYLNRHHNDNDFSFNDDDDDDDSDTTKNNSVVKLDGNSFYHTPFATGTKTARLNLSGGGTNYILNDTTTELFAANVKEYYGHYNMENHTDDSVSVVDFNMKGNHNGGHFGWNHDGKSNRAILKLNSAPLWEMNVNAGATDLNFDLTRFKIRTFTLNGGAASFKVKLGQPATANTDVTIKSGVSDITVDVPKDAACSIVSSTGLSSNSFDGFNKTSDNHYETPGFTSAKKRIYISISGGLSDFKVNRY